MSIFRKAHLSMSVLSHIALACQLGVALRFFYLAGQRITDGKPLFGAIGANSILLTIVISAIFLMSLRRRKGIADRVIIAVFMIVVVTILAANFYAGWSYDVSPTHFFG